MPRRIDSAILRSAAHDAEMNLDCLKAAAMWEAAIFAYSPRIAKLRRGQAELALMRKHLGACRLQIGRPIGHA